MLGLWFREVKLSTSTYEDRQLTTQVANPKSMLIGSVYWMFEVFLKQLKPEGFSVGVPFTEPFIYQKHSFFDRIINEPKFRLPRPVILNEVFNQVSPSKSCPWQNKRPLINSFTVHSSFTNSSWPYDQRDQDHDMMYLTEGNWNIV